MNILIPISLGELYDKISILEIKLKNIKDNEKLKNITKELNELKNISNKYPISDDLYNELKDINLKLWLIEDNIREKERLKEFDKIFISLARDVYVTNDMRSDIKREININYGSNLIEEKSYYKY